MKRALLAVVLSAVLALSACAAKGDVQAASKSDGARQASSAVATSAEGERPVDLDLTALIGTVVYSQIYDMTVEPEVYRGQRIRLKGNLSYFQDSETKREYFAAIIADATACCAQGIEFVWAGEHRYPEDYPPLDTEVTVTGTFDTYDEYGYTYLQLTDAEVTWGDI
ncbi:MAG: hypothetical protein IJ769_06910 [Clostridia bacterium]|nr:hypothetical protein [Clostridia bacterium]